MRITTSFFDGDLQPVCVHLSYLYWQSMFAIMETLLGFRLIIVIDNSAVISNTVKLKTVAFLVLITSYIFRGVMKFGSAEDSY